MEVQTMVPAQPSSWFVGNSVQSDGTLHVCTRVDPLLLCFRSLPKVGRAVDSSCPWTRSSTPPAADEFHILADVEGLRPELVCDVRDVMGPDRRVPSSTRPRRWRGSSARRHGRRALAEAQTSADAAARSAGDARQACASFRSRRRRVPRGRLGDRDGEPKAGDPGSAKAAAQLKRARWPCSQSTCPASGPRSSQRTASETQSRRRAPRPPPTRTTAPSADAAASGRGTCRTRILTRCSSRWRPSAQSLRRAAAAAAAAARRKRRR